MLFSLFIVGFRVVDFHGYSDKAIFQELFLSEMKCTPESNVEGTSGVTRLMLKKKTVLFCSQVRIRFVTCEVGILTSA